MKGKKLLTATQIAEISGLKPRTIRESYALKPDFPEAVFLPPGPKGRSIKRWIEKEIHEYFGLSDS